MDEQSVKKLANLIIEIQAVSKSLKAKRVHPLDILPIENPFKLAKRLDDAMDKFNNPQKSDLMGGDKIDDLMNKIT